jgi:hypothetical protein
MIYHMLLHSECLYIRRVYYIRWFFVLERMKEIRIISDTVSLCVSPEPRIMHNLQEEPSS